MAAKERKSLGRGLSSIIAGGGKSIKPSMASSALSHSVVASSVEKQSLSAASPLNLFSEIMLEKIVPSQYQARKEFTQESIDELAESIASEGLMQPIVVRKLEDGNFELIAGERRWRACKKLGLKRIIANIQTASDASSAVKGLIENLQRSDLNPIEEALGIANLMANFKLTQDSVSKRIGKPRSTIANSLRLLTLSKDIQNYISSGKLSLGHAKVLLGIQSEEQRSLLARRILETGINVRMAEDAANRIKFEKDRSLSKSSTNESVKNSVIRDIENRIREKLNANVEIKHSSKKGKIIIDYLDNQDLQRILELIGVEA